MFRESSAIDSERTAASVRSLYAKYSADNEGWFDGTPDSVDRRIAQCKKISNLCKAATVRLAGRNVSAQYIALAHEMDSDRAALEGLRRDILTAAADRDEDDVCGAEPPSGKYTCHKPANHPGNHANRSPDESSDGTWSEEFAKRMREGSRYRSSARHFVAEQECDDLRELLIRAQNHAERVSSTLSPNDSRAFVASFVEAVRDAAKPSRRTASRSLIAPITDFPADLMYME